MCVIFVNIYNKCVTKENVLRQKREFGGDGNPYYTYDVWGGEGGESPFTASFSCLPQYELTLWPTHQMLQKHLQRFNREHISSTVEDACCRCVDQK